MPKQSEIVTYCKSLVGKSVDHDGYYGSQCVDLIMHLQHKFYGFASWGNAIDYRSNKMPDGATRTTGYKDLQPADILVFGGAWGYGHIAMVVDVYADTVRTVEQNLRGDLEKGSPSEFRVWSKSALKNQVVSVISWQMERDLENKAKEVYFQLTKEEGAFTLDVDVINVRTEPSRKADIVAQYKKGETVFYDYKVVNSDGHNWISYRRASNGQRVYMAVRENVNGVPQKLWGVIR